MSVGEMGPWRDGMAPEARRRNRCKQATLVVRPEEIKQILYQVSTSSWIVAKHQDAIRRAQDVQGKVQQGQLHFFSSIKPKRRVSYWERMACPGTCMPPARASGV